MSDKGFDDIIKDRLDGMQSGFDPSHWTAFEQMLDGIGGDDISLSEEAFDKQVREAVNINMYNGLSENWTSLEERLELEQKRRRKLVITKGAELLILFLLVFSFWHYSIDKAPINELRKQDIVMKNQMAPSVLSESKPSPIKTKSLIDNPNELYESKYEGVLASVEHELKDEQINTDSKTHVISKMRQDLDISILPREYFGLSSRHEEKTSLDQEIVFQNTAKIISLPTKLSKVWGQQKLIKLPSKNVDKRLWLSAFSNINMDIIDKPYDEVYQQLSGLFAVMGWSAGMGIGIDYGRFELTTGLSFRRLDYKPSKIKERSGSFRIGFQESSLDRIKLDVISLPIAIQVNYLKRPKLELYAAIGGTVNSVAATDYTVQVEEISSGLRPKPVPSESAENSSRLGDKDFSKGIFQGGSLHDNTFITADIGLGLQYSLNDKISLYAEPNFSFHTSSNGIGPNDDRFHRLSLELGAKMSIN